MPKHTVHVECRTCATVRLMSCAIANTAAQLHQKNNVNMTCHAILCSAKSAVLRYDVLGCAVLRCAVSCCVMLWCAIPQYGLPSDCHAEQRNNVVR